MSQRFKNGVFSLLIGFLHSLVKFRVQHLNCWYSYTGLTLSCRP